MPAVRPPRPGASSQRTAPAGSANGLSCLAPLCVGTGAGACARGRETCRAIGALTAAFSSLQVPEARQGLPRRPPGPRSGAVRPMEGEPSFFFFFVPSLSFPSCCTSNRRGTETGTETETAVADEAGVLFGKLVPRNRGRTKNPGSRAQLTQPPGPAPGLARARVPG